MGFFGGLLEGYTGTSESMRKRGKKGLLFRKKKQSNSSPPVTGSTDTTGAYIPDFKKGGKVRGRKGRKVVATLEPGERVLTKRQAKKYRGRSKSR